MAGHSKFKNIQHRKGAQDKKKAEVFNKLVRELITANKINNSELEHNPRLRNAIATARSSNLPKERIEKALAQSSNQVNRNIYLEIKYEGFLPGGIAIIVNTLTDNKNRTASDIRSCFNKYGGHLGELGSLDFMFEHLGKIIYPVSTVSSDEILAAAIEIGANNVVTDQSKHLIYTEIELFSKSLEYLTKIFDKPSESNLEWKAYNTIVIDNEEKVANLFKLKEELKKNCAVQKVFSNYNLSQNLS